MAIQFVSGDVTKLNYGDPTKRKILAHIVNNKDKMGSGVALAILNKWRIVKDIYHQTLQVLGHTTFIKVESGIVVANMVAQDGFSSPGKPACDLDALEACLGDVSYVVREYGCELHIPLLGAGLGGRDWKTEILPLLEAQVEFSDFPLFIYSL